MRSKETTKKTLRAKLAMKSQKIRSGNTQKSAKQTTFASLGKSPAPESSGKQSDKVLVKRKSRLHNAGHVTDVGEPNLKKAKIVVKSNDRIEPSSTGVIKHKKNQKHAAEEDEYDDTGSDSFISDDSCDDDASFATTETRSVSADATSSSESDDEGSKVYDDEPFEGFGMPLADETRASGDETSGEDEVLHEPITPPNGENFPIVFGFILMSVAYAELAEAKDAEDSNKDVELAQTPSVRKSTRTRKATAKVAALAVEKKATPAKRDDSNDHLERSPYLEDVMRTSAAAPINDMTVVEHDEMLEHTYKDLVPLRPVVLTSSGTAGGTVMISNWMKGNELTINERFVVDLISFKSHEIFVNLSRVDPAALTTKQIGKNKYVSFALGNGAQMAMCVSVIVVVESFVGLPGKTPGGGPKKEITGYFLTQEFERFAAVAGAVFGHQRFWTHMVDNAFKFGTFVRPNGEQSQYSVPAPTPRSTSMFSATPSPSSAAGPSVRAVLSWDTHIPMYDYRSEKVFDPAVHLNPAMYGKALPSTTDLPVNSLALVAYTTSNFVLSNGDSGLGCNLMWAALLAAPTGSTLPDPPSPPGRSILPREPITPTKRSSKAKSTRSPKK
ncbi:hypothetical protein BJ138DRAFT_1117846 [Hygrophoropsis aurantiaca]|uniref:Uncharacterized protein n=1 Tax=Hygrophoropsis aurantiaca TaxID=72124 RepID=A0ACB7ZYW1_9AGAM|nr:hypothetical protein BJ138DRAFT_1117846 [Hygrophoropsis aurantiaca]